VTFTDTIGSTAVSLNAGSAVNLRGELQLTGVTVSASGSHTLTANYVGVTGSFLASSNTRPVYVRACRGRARLFGESRAGVDLGHLHGNGILRLRDIYRLGRFL
jgi:hypothetical protein